MSKIVHTIQQLNQGASAAEHALLSLCKQAMSADDARSIVLKDGLAAVQACVAKHAAEPVLVARGLAAVGMVGRESGQAQSVLHLMPWLRETVEAHCEEEEVVEMGIFALRVMADEHDIDVMEAGVVPFVLEMMDKWKTHAPVVEQGLGFLRNLTCEEDHLASLCTNHHIIELTVGLLKRFVPEPGVQEEGLAVLRNVSIHDVYTESLINHGALSVCIQSISTHKNNPAVLVQAMVFVRNMAADSNEARRLLVEKLGAVSWISQAFSSQAKNALVVEAAMYALGNLCRIQAGRSAFNISNDVLAAMEYFGANIETLQAIFVGLSIVALERTVQERVSATHIPVILGYMQDFGESASLLGAGFALLAALCETEDTLARLARDHDLIHLVISLLNTAKEAAPMANALTFTGFIASDAQARAFFVSNKGLTAIRVALQSHWTNSVFVSQAAAAMANIADDVDSCDEVVDEVGFNVLMDLLNEFSTTPDVISQVIRVAGQLARNPADLREMMRMGFMPKIMSLSSAFPLDYDVQTASSAALANFGDGMEFGDADDGMS